MIQMAELDSVASDAPEAPEAAEPGAQADLPEAKPAESADAQVAEAQPSQTQTAQVGQVSGFKVQLASLQDPEAAQQEWKRLQGLHPELLGNLAMQTQKVEIEGRGTFYRIQAGPLPSRETADDLCALLKGRDQPCIVVAP
jgi:cell division septation protein DedD